MISLALCNLKDFLIAHKIAYSKCRNAVLSCSHQLTGPTNLQILLSDNETICRLLHHGQTLSRFGCTFVACDQYAKRLGSASANAASQLVKLRKTESLG